MQRFQALPSPGGCFNRGVRKLFSGNCHPAGERRIKGCTEPFRRRELTMDAMMEDRRTGGILTALFGFQRFEENPRLQRVIDAVHAKTEMRELSLEEMSWLNAAGAPEMMEDREKATKGRPDIDRAGK